jgi:hypothetical protein
VYIFLARIIFLRHPKIEDAAVGPLGLAWAQLLCDCHRGGSGVAPGWLVARPRPFVARTAPFQDEEVTDVDRCAAPILSLQLQAGRDPLG